MAAKAPFAVEALPCIHRFRGHGPLLQEPSLRSRMGTGIGCWPPMHTPVTIEPF
jgi:hypothetical protein